MANLKKLINKANKGNQVAIARLGQKASKGNAAAGTALAGIQSQQQANQQAQLNRVNESGPFGSAQYTQNPDGSWSRNTSLSPEQQGLYGYLTGGAQQAGGMMNTALEGSNLGQAFNPNLPERATSSDFRQAREQYQGDMYNYLTQDFAKRREQDRQQTEQDLYNRGYRPDQTGDGPGGWNNQMSEFNKRWDTNYSNAQAQAMQMAGDEWQRNFNIQEAGIGNQLNQAQQIQNQQLAQTQGLQGLVGAAFNPGQYSGIAPIQVSAPDYTNAYGTVGNIRYQQGSLANQRAAMARSGGSGGAAPNYSPIYTAE